LPAAPQAQAAPTYDRTAWLVDSAVAADLVAVGTPGANRSTLAIERIVCGEPDPKLGDATHVTTVGPRFADERGVWILTKTVAGYYATNPEAHPIAEAEWQSAAANLPHRAPDKLDEQIYNAQILHAYQSDGNLVDQDVTLESNGELYVQLSIRDVNRIGRRIGRDGLELVYHLPAKGSGFELRYDHGRLADFANYLDGVKDGLSQRIYPDTGRIREEVHYQRGVQHGVATSWTPSGAVEYRAVYDQGLTGKIVRFTGKKTGGATLYRLEDRVTYAAPNDVLGKIRAGMTVRELSALLQVDFSEDNGLWFPHLSCEWGLRIVLGAGRVKEVRRQPNGAFCNLHE